MLVYANSEDLLAKGLEIQIDPDSILFTQGLDAELQAEIDELDDENKNPIYTYKIIIDENIYDANVDRQFKAVHKPLENGLYPFGKSKGISLEKFEKKAKDTHNSKAFYFGSELIRKQIEDTGFNAFYYYEGYYQKIYVLGSIEGLIVGAIYKGHELDIE